LAGDDVGVFILGEEEVVAVVVVVVVGGDRGLVALTGD